MGPEQEGWQCWGGRQGGGPTPEPQREAPDASSNIFTASREPVRVQVSVYGIEVRALVKKKKKKKRGGRWCRRSANLLARVADISVQLLTLSVILPS